MGGGGGEWESNQILLYELTYVPISNPNPKPCKKVMNTPTNNIEMIPLKLRMHQKKNEIKLDTRFIKYGQNSERTLD
jgi:hypothetical protein